MVQAIGPIPSLLDDLDNVNAPTPADGDGLVYDQATGKWINGAVGEGVFQPVTDQRVYASFRSDGPVHFHCPFAMTLDTPVERPGNATFAYAVAPSSDPLTFGPAAFPLALAEGDVLRVTATGMVDPYDTSTLLRVG